ncbi:MAG: cupin domain-containing protein [Bacteroidales bacterium]
MKSVLVTQTPSEDNPHKVDVRKLYDDPSAQIVHIALRPGESLKPHLTPVDVTFYVLEGSPTVHIAKESIRFEKDTLIESPARVVHHLSNEGPGLARILVIKAPRPENKSKIL